jgi:hypothetical protein
MIYPFISAILPALSPALEPPMSVAEFDDLVKEELSGKRFEQLVSWDDNSDKVAVYSDMRRFQEYLNYRIARIRAEKLNRSANFAEPDEFYGEVDYALSAAVSAQPLERERIVDAACWRKLDDLETGHEMDFEFLCIYRIRLGLLQKYSGRSSDAGRENFEAALEKLAAGFNEP